MGEAKSLFVFPEAAFEYTHRVFHDSKAAFTRQGVLRFIQSHCNAHYENCVCDRYFSVHVHVCENEAFPFKQIYTQRMTGGKDRIRDLYNSVAVNISEDAGYGGADRYRRG